MESIGVHAFFKLFGMMAVYNGIGGKEDLTEDEMEGVVWLDGLYNKNVHGMYQTYESHPILTDTETREVIFYYTKWIYEAALRRMFMKFGWHYEIRSGGMTYSISIRRSKHTDEYIVRWRENGHIVPDNCYFTDCMIDCEYTILDMAFRLFMQFC